MSERGVGVASGERASDPSSEERIGIVSRWPSWSLTPSQMCDVELLATGALAPLRGFMTRRQMEEVSSKRRLPDGTPWATVISLDVSEEFGGARAAGERIVLRGQEGEPVAALTVSDAWEWAPGSWRLGGVVESLAPVEHVDFPHLRLTAQEVRTRIERAGWTRVIAFHPDLVLHNGQLAALATLARQHDAGLLVQMFAEGDCADSLERFARVRAIDLAARQLEQRDAVVALVSVAERPTGSDMQREWLRLRLAKSFGASHIAVDAEVLARQRVDAELLRAAADSVGLEVVPLAPMARATGKVTSADDHPVTVAAIERLLESGAAVPETVLATKASHVLRQARVPHAARGFAVFFTGLSGSGKSTIARRLRARLLEITERPVTLLDGDVVRRHLSSELGFSREHRDLNILRVGYVASEIVKHRGIAICAPIAPYDATRQRVRSLVAPLGGFVLVHVDTPVEVCERRDRKGLYAKARAGILPQFTGVSDPYETPQDAELTLRTQESSPEQAVETILEYLVREGYVVRTAEGSSGQHDR